MSKKKTTPKPKFNFISYLIIIIISGLFIQIALQLNHLQDDAYITFRYAKNFLSGKGLVFNSGEFVEGYTNFLWLMILSLFSSLKFSFETVSQNFGIVSGVFALLFTYKISESIKISDNKNLRTIFNLAPVLLFALTGAFAYWTVSGMETALFIFLLLAGIYFYLNNNKNVNYPFAIFFLLATLTRPEGLLFFIVIYIHKIAFSFKREEATPFTKQFLNKKNLIELSIFFIPIIIHLIFRLVYYGYPLPNTFYAKTGFSLDYLLHGFEYIVNFAESYLLYGIVVFIPVYLLIKNKKLRFEISLFFSLVITYTIYVLIIGGDVLALHRFLLPVLPLVYILFTKTIEHLTEAKTSKPPSFRFSFILIILFAGFAAYNFYKEKDEIEKVRIHEIGLVAKSKVKAKFINNLQEVKERKLTIAASTIGALSYFSDAIVIDMLGLTDETIAHNPVEIKEISGSKAVFWKERNYNAGYVLDRKPDYIIFSTGAKPSAFAERAVFSKSEFLYYYYNELIFSKELNSTLNLYKRKSIFQINLSDPSILNAEYSPAFVEPYTKALMLNVKFKKEKSDSIFNKLFEECNKAIKLSPSQFDDIYRILGTAYLNNQDVDLAEKYLLKAVKLNDMNCIAHLNLYSIYNKLGQEEKANYHINRVSLHSPFMFNPASEF